MEEIKNKNPGFTDESVEDELKKQENLNGGKKRKTSKRKTKKGKKVGKKFGSASKSMSKIIRTRCPHGWYCAPTLLLPYTTLSTAF